MTKDEFDQLLSTSKIEHTALLEKLHSLQTQVYVHLAHTLHLYLLLDTAGCLGGSASDS